MTSILQKLMSSQFMSGDFYYYYYYMINRGLLFKVNLRFNPEILEMVKSNSEQIVASKATDPN
jgi:hypothetical protein